jgi:hypothetical protein
MAAPRQMFAKRLFWAIQPIALGHSRAAAGWKPGGGLAAPALGVLWVLPGAWRYTGAEGAESANISKILTRCCCSFGFGSASYTHAR